MLTGRSLHVIFESKPVSLATLKRPLSLSSATAWVIQSNHFILAMTKLELPMLVTTLAKLRLSITMLFYFMTTASPIAFISE